MMAPSYARTAEGRRRAGVGPIAGVGFLLMLVGIGLCFVSGVVGIFAIVCGLFAVLAARFA